MKWVLLFLAGFTSSVFSQELRVLSGGAAKSLVDPLAASFKGGVVKVDYQPMGRLVKSLEEGAEVDMVIVTEETLPGLERQGRVERGAKPIARVGIGVAVNEKAPSPDISTVDAFKRTLLAAKSVVYIDPKVGTSGKHVAEGGRSSGEERGVRGQGPRWFDLEVFREPRSKGIMPRLVQLRPGGTEGAHHPLCGCVGVHGVV